MASKKKNGHKGEHSKRKVGSDPAAAEHFADKKDFSSSEFASGSPARDEHRGRYAPAQPVGDVMMREEMERELELGGGD